MKKTFEDLLAIAKKNVEENPSIVGADTKHVSKRYLDSLVDEVKEVCDELVPDNVVFLEDELSDIA